VITYGGPSAGSSVVMATTRDAFDFHPGGIFAGGTTQIDMHTEEEKLLGLNFRRAPQPFVGFWFSEDPAASFPGFRDGGGSGNGGCSGSADRPRGPGPEGVVPVVSQLEFKTPRKGTSGAFLFTPKRNIISASTRVEILQDDRFSCR
jgi:hypothetical protein